MRVFERLWTASLGAPVPSMLGHAGSAPWAFGATYHHGGQAFGASKPIASATIGRVLLEAARYLSAQGQFTCSTAVQPTKHLA